MSVALMTQAIGTLDASGGTIIVKIFLESNLASGKFSVKVRSLVLTILQCFISAKKVNKLITGKTTDFGIRLPTLETGLDCLLECRTYVTSLTSPHCCFWPSKQETISLSYGLFRVLRETFCNAPEAVSGTKQIFTKLSAVHQATQRRQRHREYSQ